MQRFTFGVHFLEKISGYFLTLIFLDCNAPARKQYFDCIYRIRGRGLYFLLQEFCCGQNQNRPSIRIGLLFCFPTIFVRIGLQLELRPLIERIRYFSTSHSLVLMTGNSLKRQKTLRINIKQSSHFYALNQRNTLNWQKNQKICGKRKLDPKIVNFIHCTGI